MASRKDTKYSQRHKDYFAVLHLNLASLRLIISSIGLYRIRVPFDKLRVNLQGTMKRIINAGSIKQQIQTANSFLTKIYFQQFVFTAVNN